MLRDKAMCLIGCGVTRGHLFAWHGLLVGRAYEPSDWLIRSIPLVDNPPVVPDDG
jgi:hypothetical protein